MSEGSNGHWLAITTYVGALVLGLGLIVMVTGLLTSGGPSERKLGFDLSLWWGLVMTLFGAVLLVGDVVARRRR